MLETTCAWLVGPGCWWAGVKGDHQVDAGEGRLAYAAFTTPSVPVSTSCRAVENHTTDQFFCCYQPCFSVSIAPVDSSLAYLVYSGRVDFCPRNWDCTAAAFGPRSAPPPPNRHQRRKTRPSSVRDQQSLNQHNGASWRVIQQSSQEVQVRSTHILQVTGSSKANECSSPSRLVFLGEQSGTSKLRTKSMCTAVS